MARSQLRFVVPTDYRVHVSSLSRRTNFDRPRIHALESTHLYLKHSC